MRNYSLTVPHTGGALARRTTVGVLVGIVALLVTQALVDGFSIDVGITGSMSPFAAGPLVGTTIVAGVGAAVVYAVTVRVTDRPARNFVTVAGIVFALMLIPVVFVTPSQGITTAGQLILVVYHLLVTVSLVAFITGAVEL